MGTPKNILSKVLEMSVCCHRATAFTDMKCLSIPRAFKKWHKFVYFIIYLGKYYDEFEGCVKKTQCSPHRRPVVEH